MTITSIAVRAKEAAFLSFLVMRHGAIVTKPFAFALEAWLKSLPW